MKHCFLFILSLLVLAACSDEESSSSGSYLTIDESYKNIEVDAETTYYTVAFTARTSWTAEVASDSQSWLTLSVSSGIGGSMSTNLRFGANSSSESRSGKVTISCGSESVTITLTQAGTTVQIMDESDVADIDKYYKPAEFSTINMFRSDAKWSWFRHKQSEHFFVFWEAGFGDDPNDSSVDSALRVDIDDLLVKAEQFYETNITKLGMADTGSGKSYLDLYKMEIYLLYQTDWLATGSGYDNVIGALWVNPSTCQPVGSTIAHEIGHSFQYQVYCDKLYQGEADDYTQGFRYGYENSNGGNGFWEQCAQWQSYQDYPEEMFTTYNFDVWLENNHRHFEHEWMRYASYWLQTYWTSRHGDKTIASIWKQSAYPDDAIQTYMNLYCNGSWDTMSEERFDYATRMASFDIDGMREYSDGYQGRYSTTMYSTSDGYYQVAYANCPGTTGFNVIPLNVPDGGTTVSVDFVGLSPGSALAASDPGEYMLSEATAGTRSQYNTAGKAANEGWRYAFVALKSDGTRVYGDTGYDKEGSLSFEVPSNTEYLWLVVMGCPTVYNPHPWDESELTDEQWPYKVALTNTDLKGNFTLDTSAEPQSISFAYTVNCNASSSDYELGSITIADDDLQALAQAFVMQPSEISSITKSISSGSTVSPSEGTIVFALTQSSGKLSYTYTANSGFYCTASGDAGSWSNGDPLWVEYDPSTFTLTYGHYPGKSVSGTKYIIKPTLVYTYNGSAYTATFNLTMQF